MSRIAYVNGRYLPHRTASVSIDDRGYQFADGVYEVMAVADGTLVDEAAHFDRLARSLRELRIAWPVERDVLALILRRVIAGNRVGHGMLYLQITRGVARRAHEFPIAARPRLVITARATRPLSPARLRSGIAVVTLADQRWARCDIKSISLLPNVLAKQAARDAGADEAWQVAADGTVTEGASSNAWIATPDGNLRTRPAGADILNGITRMTVLAVARARGIAVEERAFTVTEAYEAAEAFVTSTTQGVMPVTRIDGRRIGSGGPGPVTQAILAALPGRDGGR